MDVSLESKSLPSVGYSRKSYLPTTSQRLARDKLVHLYGWRSLALSSVGPGSFRRTPQHCAKWVLSHPGRRYQMIRIRPSREVETLSFSIRRHNSGREQIGSSWVQIGGSRAQNLSRYVVRTPSDGVSGRPVWVRSTPKMKLSCHDRLDRVSFVMKTRQDNDMSDRTSVVYAKNNNELSSSIRSGADFDKN
uniref:Uncharacterized protein n=1 Tax=Vitis vinifera TaxID=29760 RepID=A5BU23_VITVI|nr:hypothetical protein VITISV_014929 [Vitis vinifera]